jgi:nitrite reductase/ring-hydroxylating ferredoxin subunit
MGWHRLCDFNDLQQGQGSEFAVAGKVVAAFLRGDRVLAIDGMCAHQGGPIAQGQVDGDCVTCPWHGWQYDLSTGCNLISGKKLLETFATEIRNGEVWIEVET